MIQSGKSTSVLNAGAALGIQNVCRHNQVGMSTFFIPACVDRFAKIPKKFFAGRYKLTTRSYIMEIILRDHWITVNPEALEKAVVGDVTKDTQSAMRRAFYCIAWGSVAAGCVIGSALVILVPMPTPALLIKGIASGGIAVSLLSDYKN